MRFRNFLAIIVVPFLTSPLLGSPAAAQAGSGPGIVAGPFTAITIRTVVDAGPLGQSPSISFLPYVGQGLGQTGQIKPTPAAMIMQTTAPGTGPHGLTLAPGACAYGGQPRASQEIVNINIEVFAVQTNFSFDVPHPGTAKLGAAAVTQESGGPIPTGPMVNKFFAGGRVGAATVSFYADATANGTVGTNFRATVE